MSDTPQKVATAKTDCELLAFMHAYMHTQHTHALFSHLATVWIQLLLVATE